MHITSNSFTIVCHSECHLLGDDRVNGEIGRLDHHIQAVLVHAEHHVMCQVVQKCHIVLESDYGLAT